jgi:hypothetical protein
LIAFSLLESDGLEGKAFERAGASAEGWRAMHSSPTMSLAVTTGAVPIC